AVARARAVLRRQRLLLRRRIRPGRRQRHQGNGGPLRSRRVRVRRTLAAVTLALGAAAAPSVARAASCGKPDLVDMVPPDLATGVPLNARLGAHYATAAEYQGEDVVLVHPGGREE